jgi:hypothetical protein
VVGAGSRKDVGRGHRLKTLVDNTNKKVAVVVVVVAVVVVVGEGREGRPRHRQ